MTPEDPQHADPAEPIAVDGHRRGVRQAGLVFGIVAGLILLPGLAELMGGRGEYRGLGLAMLFFFGWPALALFQWVWILPWALSRPDPLHRRGLLVGAAWAAGVAILLPGLVCAGMLTLK